MNNCRRFMKKRRSLLRGNNTSDSASRRHKVGEAKGTTFFRCLNMASHISCRPIWFLFGGAFPVSFYYKILYASSTKLKIGEHRRILQEVYGYIFAAFCSLPNYDFASLIFRFCIAKSANLSLIYNYLLNTGTHTFWCH